MKGFPVSEWHKPPGRRNEALDEAVYARAALEFAYTKYHRKSIWDQIERSIHLKGIPVGNAPPPAAAEGSPPVTPSQENPPPTDDDPLKNAKAARNMTLKRPSKGFVGRW
ncbi:MAG TPA: terminase gpA endonuclease subunit [Rhodothermia bacterium]